MGQIRFTTARHASPCITIVSADAWPKVFISLGGPKESFSTEVHYVESLKRSLPHEDRDCPHCIYPLISKTWVPAAQCPLSFGGDVMEKTRLALLDAGRTPLTDWQTKVVELPPSAMMCATRLARGTAFAIVRGKGREWKKVYYRIFEGEYLKVGPVFDVRPFLLKSWGKGPDAVVS